MFTTHGESFEELTNEVGTDGEMNWLYTSRRQNTPWFHVGAYAQANGIVDHYTILMIDNIRALEVILTRNEYLVVAIQVVIPSYMSGKDGWHMEPLSELEYRLDSDGMQVAVYRMKGGRTYRHSSHGEFDSPNSGGGSRAAPDENCIFQWFPAQRNTEN